MKDRMIDFTFQIVYQDNAWCVTVEENDKLSVCSDSWEEAQEMMRDLLESYFEDMCVEE